MLPARTRLVAVPALLVLTLLLGGCGSSDDSEPSEAEPTATATSPPAPPGARARACGDTTVAGTSDTRVTGIGCDVGRGIVAVWTKEPDCAPAAGAARASCSVYEGFRCLAVVADRGIAVSCSRPGASVVFLARRD